MLWEGRSILLSQMLSYRLVARDYTPTPNTARRWNHHTISLQELP